MVLHDKPHSRETNTELDSLRTFQVKESWGLEKKRRWTKVLLYKRIYPQMLGKKHKNNSTIYQAYFEQPFIPLKEALILDVTFSIQRIFKHH